MVIFVNHRVTFFTTFLLQKFNWVDIAIIFDSDSYSPGHQGRSLQVRQGLEVIKLEFIPKLKVKRNDCVRKQPIIALYFEYETVFKFYNPEARDKKYNAFLK